MRLDSRFLGNDNNMEKIIKSKSFWLSFAIVALVVFTLLLNFYRVSKSTIDILIIPKSQLAASQFETVIANFQKIPLALSFYGRVTAQNPFLWDPKIAELPKNKIRAHWQNKIQTERLGQSGILRVTLIDKERAQSEAFAEQTKKTIIILAGIYYNIRDDIDVRILDGGITKEEASVPVSVIIIESAGSSFFLVFLIFAAAGYFFPEKRERLTDFIKDRFTLSALTPKKEMNESIQKTDAGWNPTAEQPYEFFTPHLEYPERNLAGAGFTKKAPAPDNLPIIEEKPKEFDIEKKEEELLEYGINDADQIIKEATPEEVKDRLNKLLSGM